MIFFFFFSLRDDDNHNDDDEKLPAVFLLHEAGIQVGLVVCPTDWIEAGMVVLEHTGTFQMGPHRFGQWTYQLDFMGFQVSLDSSGLFRMLFHWLRSGVGDIKICDRCMMQGFCGK